MLWKPKTADSSPTPPNNQNQNQNNQNQHQDSTISTISHTRTVSEPGTTTSSVTKLNQTQNGQNGQNSQQNPQNGNGFGQLGPSSNSNCSNSTISTGKALQNPQNRTGVVIYPFQNYQQDSSTSSHFLSLDLGETVIISSEVAPGWYYGHKKYHPNSPGLFPTSYIFKQHHEFLDFLEKISEVCREWGEIRKKLYVEVHAYQFDHISRGIFELIEGRRSILNQSLTQDQYREVTRRLCSRIDWGNRKLGLDLVPWNWLLEDEDSINSILNSNSGPDSLSQQTPKKILPDCNRDAGKLFKLHQKSVESISRGSSTLSRPKSKKAQEQQNDLYVSLRDFSYTFTDDCEISFSLFDGKRFISERHIILQQHNQLPQSNFHLNERPTVFKDISQKDKKDLYLVVQIVRIGRMFYADTNQKKYQNTKLQDKRQFRRPYACGVLVLSDLDTLEDDLEVNSKIVEKQVKLYNSDEKDFFQVHELIVSQNYRNIVSKIIPVLNSFSLSVFWCSYQNLGKVGVGVGPGGSSLLSSTRLIGFNNLIAPPGVVRNDLYLTLQSVELLEKKQNKTGGAKSCNLEVELQIVDDDEDLLTLPDCNNCYKSIILHHINNPKYNETLKFTIPIEVFPKSKLRLILRHCSTKDKSSQQKKMFAISWLNLMDPSGTTVKDGVHLLQVYKWTDESSLPIQSTQLNLSKDTVVIKTLMVSTKFTQNIDLVNLLKWKQTGHNTINVLKPSLENLIKSNEATEEIVRKFLQDVLDALFTIFSGEDGNSTEYSGDVFTLLVNIFQLLETQNYKAYKDVLNTYIVEHFAAALVYKGLLKSTTHYTQVLLNFGKEDVTQSIQNCYRSLEFIFKFVVQSQVLFAKATGGQLEDSFRRDVKTLTLAFCQVFKCTDCSPVFVETQGILLKNLDKVYEQLLRVMNIIEVCELVCEIFNSIPIKESNAHPLSPAKLQAIYQIVKSSLFKPKKCRGMLLPVMCRHIRHHLKNREELKLCTDVLGEILIYLNDLKVDTHTGSTGSGSGSTGSEAHADIEVLCTTTLEMLVQSVLVLERTSSIVGNLVTCLISLLEQMDHYHYNRLWDEFHERKPLRDLLLRVFLLFRDLIKHEVFPGDWSFMKLLTCHVMLQSLQEFCQPLITDFLKFFDVQLWTQYFSLAVTFINQPGLQLEKFREEKKEWILSKYGDMRLKMGYQMLNLWSHLGDLERKEFIPGMIGPFLEVTMIPQEELREVTLQTLFYDMMQTEFRIGGVVKDVEEEMMDKLDVLMNNGDGNGDEEYRVMFREVHLKRLGDEEKKNAKNGKKPGQNPNSGSSNWFITCTQSIESLSKLQQLLLDYRDIFGVNKQNLQKINPNPGIAGNLENRDKLIQCTVNLLNFYNLEKRTDQYLRYVYKLHDLHYSSENYTEAGFTLLLHGHLLRFDRERFLPEFSGFVVDPNFSNFSPFSIQYPRQKEGERKELLYLRVLSYFDQGKVWEKGISLCKELASQYEKRFDYQKLSRILQTQAQFYDNILNQHRPEPEYFRVGFFGQGFPLFVRNKEFIYRGMEYERLAPFIQRILMEWPEANLMQKNSPADPKLLDGEEMNIQICCVKPKSMERPGFGMNSGRNSGKGTLKNIPEKIKSFYLVNDVKTFQYDRRIEKIDKDLNESISDAGAGGEPNEFKTMWIVRTTLSTDEEFPGTLRQLEITCKQTVELSPVEFACEKMEEANEQLGSLMGQYSQTEEDSKPEKNVNPLSMRLQGMLDAAVMGGIPKYTEAFFNEEFLKQEQEDPCGNNSNGGGFVLKLIGLLQEQVKLLEEGLEIHGRLVPPGVQPLHKRLLECHCQMKGSVQETELMIHSTLAALNNATLRRSESGTGSSTINSGSRERDSFRKLAGGKSIVNSPLPPVPLQQNSGHLGSLGRKDEGTGSNRSSISSGGGYGHVTKRMGGRRDIDDEDDDVYSHPVDQESGVKPPMIPSRMKKASVSSQNSESMSSNSNEYIIMPPSRLREIAGSGGHSPTPTPTAMGQNSQGQGHSSLVQGPVVPPKPSTPNKGTNSPPPPLLPRKPVAASVSLPIGALPKTISTSGDGINSIKTNANVNSNSNPNIVVSLTSTSTPADQKDKEEVAEGLEGQRSPTSPGSPPPVPPKPKSNGNKVEDPQNTYMNKEEIQKEMDSLNMNMNKDKVLMSPIKNGSLTLDRVDSSMKSPARPETPGKDRRPGSGHKEFFVPPGAAGRDQKRDSSASN